MHNQSVVGGERSPGQVDALLAAELWLDGKAEYEMRKSPNTWATQLLRDAGVHCQGFELPTGLLEKSPVPFGRTIKRHEIQAGYTRFLCNETNWCTSYHECNTQSWCQETDSPADCPETDPVYCTTFDAGGTPIC